MRVSKEKAAENRQRIVDAASRLFRERGIAATGVDSISSAAGMTHGAVYSQFGSKEAIAIDAIRKALRSSIKVWLRVLAKKGKKKSLPAIVESYLSPAHRDAPGRGCVIAALGADISRQPRGVRDAFTEEFVEVLGFLTELIASDDNSISRDDALATLASMTGALALSRAVTDETLSNRILAATTKWIETGAANSRSSESG